MLAKKNKNIALIFFFLSFFHVIAKSMKIMNQWSESGLRPFKVVFSSHFCWSLIMPKIVKIFKLLGLINKICPFRCNMGGQYVGKSVEKNMGNLTELDSDFENVFFIDITAIFLFYVKQKN